MASSHAPRLIARLDIKAPNLVKGIQLEGLRVMGDPAEHAMRYYADGVDELLYVDIVATLYERNSLVGLVEATAAQIFVPLTVGGGIRTIEDINALLRAGADKVAINTAAVRNPQFIRDASRTFGSQCIVLSVEAKRQPNGTWEAYTDNGRERTGLDAIDWVRRAVDLGAGEVLLTSVDREGMRRGFDVELLSTMRDLSVPLIASGGANTVDHLRAAISAGADAVAVASVLHYKTETVTSLKAGLAAHGIPVRAM